MDFGVIAFYLVLSVLTLCYYMNRVRNNRNRERKLREEATKLWYQKILWKYNIRSHGQETAQPAMPKRWYSKIQRKLGIGSSGRSYCETASDLSIGPIFKAFFDGDPHNTENQRSNQNALIDLSSTNPEDLQNIATKLKREYVRVIVTWGEQHELRTMSKFLVQRLEFSDFHAISNAGVVAREYSDITAYRKAAGLYHSQGYVFEQIGYLTSAAQAYESASVCLEQLIARGREPRTPCETTEYYLSKQQLNLCNEQACLHLAKAAQLLRSSGQPDKAAGLSLRMHRLEGPRTRSPLYRSLWGWFLAYGEDPKIALLQLLNMIGFFAIGYTALVKFNKGSLLVTPTPSSVLDHASQWQSLLGHALYFSVVTATTLGYGDVVPTGALRIMSGVEALSGIFLTTLFVVSLVRYLL